MLELKFGVLGLCPSHFGKLLFHISVFMSWLGSAISDVGIVVVGLQEVEMGAGFLAMSAAKETVRSYLFP